VSVRAELSLCKRIMAATWKSVDRAMDANGPRFRTCVLSVVVAGEWAPSRVGSTRKTWTASLPSGLVRRALGARWGGLPRRRAARASSRWAPGCGSARIGARGAPARPGLV